LLFLTVQYDTITFCGRIHALGFGAAKYAATELQSLSRQSRFSDKHLFGSVPQPAASRISLPGRKAFMAMQNQPLSGTMVLILALNSEFLSGKKQRDLPVGTKSNPLGLDPLKTSIRMISSPNFLRRTGPGY